MTTGDQAIELRVSDADRNGTLRRLANALALGLIDIEEFDERSTQVSRARTRGELDGVVDDLPAPGAIVTSVADRVELRGWAGSLKRHGEWVVPTRLALVRRLGSIHLDLAKARFAGPVVVIELDMVRGSVDIRLPEGASASIDDVTVYGGSARDRRKDRTGGRHAARGADRSDGLGLVEHPRSALAAAETQQVSAMRARAKSRRRR